MAYLTKQWRNIACSSGSCGSCDHTSVLQIFLFDDKLLVHHVLTVAGPHKELAQVHHLKRMHHQCIQIDKLKPQEKPIWNNLHRLTTKNRGSGFHEISSSFFHTQTCPNYQLHLFIKLCFIFVSNFTKPSCSQAEEKHVVASRRLALLARSSERQAACTARLPSEKRAILTSNASNTPRAWTGDDAPNWGTSTRIHDRNYIVNLRYIMVIPYICI